MANKSGNHGLQGMTFGSIDAIIGVIGIVVGLGVVGDRTALFVAVLVYGIANSFGNAWGFHVSEETENVHTRKEVWMSTIMSFGGTFLSTIVLIIPVILLPLLQAIYATILFGITLIVLIGILVSRIQGLGVGGCCKMVAEYVTISLIVVAISYYLGQVASGLLG